MTPSAFLVAIRDALRTELPGMTVEVIDQRWGHKDKDRQTIKAPSVLLACLRMTPDQDTHGGDFDTATVAAVCIAQRSDSQRDGQRTKAATAMDLASHVSLCVRGNRWGVADGVVNIPTRISVEPVGVDLDDKGYAAWAVYWSQLFDPHAAWDATAYGPLHAVNNTIVMGDANTPDKHVTYTATGAP